jgi:alpha-beta hydrolase superfamily lysophospholipase
VSAATLITVDDIRLAGRWWHPRGTDVRGEAVVVVHGFCGSKDAPEVELIALRQSTRGRRVLTFDLRGHGESGGATTLGLHEGRDVDAAVAAARLDADRVLVVGASMGGIATIEHLCGPAEAPGAAGTPDVSAEPSEPAGSDGARGGTTEEPADGAVIVATPARWKVPRSTRGVLAMALTQTRAGRLVAARRMGTRVAVRPGRGGEPVVRAGCVSRPVAVLHGLADRFVAPAAGEAIYTALGGPRLLDLVPGMGHGFCAAAAEPIDDALDWLVAEAGGVAGPATGGTGGRVR